MSASDVAVIRHSWHVFMGKEQGCFLSDETMRCQVSNAKLSLLFEVRQSCAGCYGATVPECN